VAAVVGVALRKPGRRREQAATAAPGKSWYVSEEQNHGDIETSRRFLLAGIASDGRSIRGYLHRALRCQ
jgi:hypothetical protein